MRAKIKATGEVVEITGNCRIRGGSTYIPAWELDAFVEETPIDWEQRRYELAKAAMNGLLGCCNYLKDDNNRMLWAERGDDSQLAKQSISIADEMVNQLKGGQG